MRTHGRPLAVNVAGFCLILLAAWQTHVQFLPALVQGPGAAVEEGLGIALWLFIIWGVFTLRGWAWWLAVIPLTVMTLGCGVALVYFDDFVALSEMKEIQGVYEILAATALVSATGLGCLLSGSSRAAFR